MVKISNHWQIESKLKTLIFRVPERDNTDGEGHEKLAIGLRDGL